MKLIQVSGDECVGFVHPMRHDIDVHYYVSLRLKLTISPMYFDIFSSNKEKCYFLSFHTQHCFTMSSEAIRLGEACDVPGKWNDCGNGGGLSCH